MPDSPSPQVWRPDRSVAVTPWPQPPMGTALLRGAMGLCPACGKTHAFAGYLKVVPECAACGAPLGELRADDAPPYFTIFIVGHLLAPMVYWFEHALEPPLWVFAAVFLPLATVLTLGLLRPVKGATLGLMLKLGMVKANDT